MKRPLKYLPLCALLLPLALAPRAHAAEAPQDALPVATFENLRAGKPQVVVAYGTSLTISGAWAKALGGYFEKEFPGQVTFVNAARGGMSSVWGVNNLQQRVLSKKPDLVFLEFAANDAKADKKVSLEKARANLDGMVKALRAQNPAVDVVLQTMNPAWDSPKSAPKKYGSDRPKLAEYNGVYRIYAREQGLPLVDNYPAWLKVQQQEPEKYKQLVPDGIHPSSEASLAVTWPAVESLLTKARAVAAAAPAKAAPAKEAAKETVTLPVREKLHIYLLMGQSNMVGRDTRTLDAQASSPRALSFSEKGEWVVARDPLHDKSNHLAVGVGPGVSFALEMLKSDAEATVALVPCAVGGTPLSRWVKGGDLYENAVRRAKAASQSGVIKGVLWHQGEAETGSQEKAESYEARLTQMLKDLRADLGTPGLPVVVGQLGEFLLTNKKHPYATTVRSAIQRMPDAVPGVGYADSAGLGHKGDNLHFDAAAERELGVRYAKAMQALQKK